MDGDYDALDRLVKLRDSGAITQDEFAARKASLLDNISSDEADKGSFAVRLKAFLTRAEGVYLAVLRAATLIFATILIAYAAWLGLSGLYNVSRNAETVKEEPAVVAASEVVKTNPDESGAAETAQKKSDAPDYAAEKKFYQSSLDQYYKLYRTSFESYRKDDDKKLTKAEFDNRFLSTQARIASLASSDFKFEQDKADVTALINVMTEVAALPETQKRLATYKAAQRKRVEEKINRTRDETYCAYYGYYIGSCIAYDTRKVNYIETKVSMKLPAGVVSHVDLFATYQRNFIETLMQRRKANAEKAEAERNEILAANAKGKENMWTAIMVAGAFMALMFFFLLIAIERHQRKLAGR